jgi:hypothetical protein
MSNPSDSQNTKIGFEQGGDVLFVKSGGKIRVEAGATLETPEGAFASVTFDSTYFEVNDGEVTLNAETAALLALIDGIPDTDPETLGEVWNDGGTLKVSAGPGC